MGSSCPRDRLLGGSTTSSPQHHSSHSWAPQYHSSQTTLLSEHFANRSPECRMLCCVANMVDQIEPDQFVASVTFLSSRGQTNELVIEWTTSALPRFSAALDF